jgi:hypothetical protein
MNVEAKLLMFTFAFEVLVAVRVAPVTDVRHERPRTAIEGIGAVREGVLRARPLDIFFWPRSSRPAPHYRAHACVNGLALDAGDRDGTERSLVRGLGRRPCWCCRLWWRHGLLRRHAHPRRRVAAVSRLPSTAASLPAPLGSVPGRTAGSVSRRQPTRVSSCAAGSSCVIRGARLCRSVSTHRTKILSFVRPGPYRRSPFPDPPHSC